MSDSCSTSGAATAVGDAGAARIRSWGCRSIEAPGASYALRTGDAGAERARDLAAAAAHHPDTGVEAEKALVAAPDSNAATHPKLELLYGRTHAQAILGVR
eukprot:6397868-Prymnesium_polylepis.1